MSAVSGFPAYPFISHAYDDSEALALLLSSLPEGVQPLIFPPIQVAPNAKVSNELIRAILQADSLIYLRGGHSASSPWVAFERDYALRNGKPVFSFDPSTSALERDASTPADMRFYIISHFDDEDIVWYDIARFMQDERGFSGHVVLQSLSHVLYVQQLLEDVLDTVQRGGYVLVFWSKHVLLDTEWMNSGNPKFEWPHFVFRKKALAAYGRLMPLGLEQERYIIVELDNSEVQPMFDKNMHIRLYGDDEMPLEHRVDQLIVQLYWLMYRDQFETKTMPLDSSDKP